MVVVFTSGLLFTELGHAVAASGAATPSTATQQHEVRAPTAATSPPRKRPCLLFGHYSTQPAVQGQHLVTNCLTLISCLFFYN